MTFAVAIAFGCLRLNIGIGSLAVASIPLAAVFLWPQPSMRSKRRLRRFAILLAALPVYFLSFFPYLSATHVFRRSKPPQWEIALHKAVYAPHNILFTNEHTKSHLLRFATPLWSAWNDVFGLFAPSGYTPNECSPVTNSSYAQQIVAIVEEYNPPHQRTKSEALGSPDTLA